MVISVDVQGRVPGAGGVIEHAYAATRISKFHRRLAHLGPAAHKDGPGQRHLDAHGPRAVLRRLARPAAAAAPMRRRLHKLRETAQGARLCRQVCTSAPLLLGICSPGAKVEVGQVVRFVGKLRWCDCGMILFVFLAYATMCPLERCSLPLFKASPDTTHTACCTSRRSSFTTNMICCI